MHVALGEAAYAYKYVLLGPKGNRSTQLHMQATTQLLEKNAHFLL